APVTQDLLRLALDLLLLARDEGDDVVDDVEGQDPALAARARDRLKRGHHHGAHAEGVVQRLERDGQAGGRAVGDGRDEAAPAARAALVVESLGVRIVDAGDQDWDIGLIAKGGGSADDRHPFRKARLPDFRDLFGDGAEDQVERLCEELLIVQAWQREERAVGAALGEPPTGTGWVAQRVAERFSRRALGGADRGHTEPWVPLERGQHLLPREAGGSEHADAQVLGHATTAGAFSAAASACSKSAARAFASCRRCPSRTSKSSVVLRPLPVMQITTVSSRRMRPLATSSASPATTTPPAGSLRMPSVCASSAIASWTAAELLHHLERQRLAALRVKGAEVDVDDRPAVEVSELDAQPVDIVVGAVDLDDGRAVSAGGANFARLQSGRNEDQGTKSGARGVGRHRAGEVSGGGAGERVEAIGTREVGGDCDVAVLEGPGWIQGVVLEIEMVETEHLPEVGRFHQGREAGSQVDRLAGGGRHQLAIAPDGVG